MAFQFPHLEITRRKSPASTTQDHTKNLFSSFILHECLMGWRPEQQNASKTHEQQYHEACLTHTVYTDTHPKLDAADAVAPNRFFNPRQNCFFQNCRPSHTPMQVCLHLHRTFLQSRGCLVAVRWRRITSGILTQQVQQQPLRGQPHAT